MKLSGNEFKKVDSIGGDELIWSGALLAAAKKRLAADDTAPDFKSSFVTSAGYGDWAHLIAHASLGDGLTLTLLVHPSAYDKTSVQRTAESLGQRWREALARRDGLAEAVDKARARIEAALGRNGGTSRLVSIGLGIQHQRTTAKVASDHRYANEAQETSAIASRRRLRTTAERRISMTMQYSVRVPDDATSLERQFLEALQRIMRGDATHPSIRAKASQGRFRPSVSSVALEAVEIGSRSPLESYRAWPARSRGRKGVTRRRHSQTMFSMTLLGSKLKRP